MNVKNDIAISESGFVFNPTTGESFTVNPIGAKIIQLIREKKSSEETVKFITEQYNIDDRSAENDLNDFISMLKQYEILSLDEE
jgi:hypothetical protein